MPFPAIRRAAPPALLVLSWILVAGCGPPKRNPVPAELTASAIVPGLPEARVWGHNDVARDPQLAITNRQLRESGLGQGTVSWLAISGGGRQGAFGVGILVGWTAAGTRPEFQFVTGISVGALIAPFAFLGPDYDHVLEDVFTTLRTQDVIERRGIRVLYGDALADSTPLRKLIERNIHDDMLVEIAAEHDRGRRLFVGTTDLDLRQPVVWDIGAIVSSDHPDAFTIARQVLLASASIPGAMPPVLFEVEADGRRYDEMHVDGGVTSQVFCYPASLEMQETLRQIGLTGEIELFIILNSRAEPHHKPIERRIVPIATASLESLIRVQALGDIYEAYLATQRDGIGFHNVAIPTDFEVHPNAPFDPVYMEALFKVGYDMAANGDPWEETPPGFFSP